MRNLLQATQVQEHLLSIQPAFKADLLAGVEAFIVDTNEFVANYDIRSVLHSSSQSVYFNHPSQGNSANYEGSLIKNKQKTCEKNVYGSHTIFLN